MQSFLYLAEEVSSPLHDTLSQNKTHPIYKQGSAIFLADRSFF
jgi:hypothetical protein